MVRCRGRQLADLHRRDLTVDPLPRELDLPERFLRPILPSPRLLVEAVVEAKADGYPDLPDPFALIDCPVPEAEVKRSAPSLHAYFQRGVKEGLLQRRLVSRRQPWYQQEQRPAAPFLCTYMGRGTGKTKPFQFIWNKSRATAANVYLMLYPTDALKEALRVRPGLAAEVLVFLNSIGAELLRSSGRVYGGRSIRRSRRSWPDFRPGSWRIFWESTTQWPRR